MLARSNYNKGCVFVENNKKRENIFKDFESLKEIEDLLSKCDMAIDDKTCTVNTCKFPEKIGGIIGGSIGSVGSVALLYGMGSVTGLSAAGVSSGLVAVGGVIGGGMAVGATLLTMPVFVGAYAGSRLIKKRNENLLEQEKERLYVEAIKKQEAMIQEIKNESDAGKDRLSYLQGLNEMLIQVIRGLNKDLYENRPKSLGRAE